MEIIRSFLFASKEKRAARGIFGIFQPVFTFFFFLVAQQSSHCILSLHTITTFSFYHLRDLILACHLLLGATTSYLHHLSACRVTIF